MPNVQIIIDFEVPRGFTVPLATHLVLHQLSLRADSLGPLTKVQDVFGEDIGECHLEVITPTVHTINDALEHEGWAIRFTTGTQDEGDWRIERDDELAAFQTDAAVWEHVYDRAMQGSKWHKAALEFIANNNVTEWELIKEHIPALRSTLE